jgi:small subunit ribosomal protein S29
MKQKAVGNKASDKKGRTLRLAKNTRSQSARAPAPGERKALRKRIVLSNTNALEVEGLLNLTADKLARHDPNTVALEKYAGQVLGMNNETVDALRALESFKPTQAWSLFRRPAGLIRTETAQLANHLANAEEGDRMVTRKVLYGSKGSGKSVLLLQAHAMACLKEWVVVHLPEGQDLTNAHTSYQPFNTPDGTVYIQPHYTAKLLSNIARANQTLLSGLQLSQQHRLPIPVQPNISLARFAELGAQDVDLAWPIWQALWTELTTPSQPNSKEGLSRPPILVTMDGVNHAMRRSAYLDDEAQPIHAHDIAIVRHFNGLISGQTSLPNGGMVLAATCDSNRPSAPTLDFCLERSHAIQRGHEPPEWDPYVLKDSRVEAVLNDVMALNLQGLSKAEARGVMEYYARSGMFRNTVTDGLVSEKWTLAGSGIIGELERASVRARF